MKEGRAVRVERTRRVVVGMEKRRGDGERT